MRAAVYDQPFATAEGKFGSPANADRLAAVSLNDAGTPAAPAHASTEATLLPASGFNGLLDPKGSALFWIGLAAVLGLVIVTGQLKVSAALRARGGR
jgi:hypothetical protein